MANGGHAFGSTWRAVLVTILVVAFGISDEIHQSFVPNRDASLADVIADGIGGCAATFVLVWWHRRTRR